ncbi:hypothetical protein ATB93_06505 [Sphingomonas sp. WG]|nr:hypothetical protein ATB93_06505 [Sphingomonas sp. WG]
MLRRAGPRDKRDFAKCAASFVKWTGTSLPGFPLLWIACTCAAGLMIVTGGFGTSTLPLPKRISFWLLLMGWNALKWQMLFALFVRKPRDWLRVASVGVILLNLPLPAEIRWSAAVVGITIAAVPGVVWAQAAVIGLIALATCFVTARVLQTPAARNSQDKAVARSAGAGGVAPAAAIARAPGADIAAGLLARARVAPEALLAVQAQDHYCRVYSRKSSALVHYKFGDALQEIAMLDGTRVHRGMWVAAGAVAGAERKGRRWRLLLCDGSQVPVSVTYLPEVRRRGWLAISD